MKYGVIYLIVVVLLAVVVAGIIGFAPRSGDPGETVSEGGSGLNIEREMVSDCDLAAPFSCRLQSFEDGQMVFVLLNSRGANYIVKELHVEDCEGAGDFPIRKDQGLAREFDCDFDSDVFEKEVVVYYKDSSGGPNLVSKGVVSRRIIS